MMDDKTKHRIVGIVVVAAFLVILVPALFKNSFWGESSKAVEETKYAQDERPVIDSTGPSASTAPETENFQTSQIAQVSLDEANKSEEQPLALTSESPASVQTPAENTATMDDSPPVASSAAPAVSREPGKLVQPTATMAPEPVAKPIVVKPAPPKPTPIVAQPKPVVPPKPAVKADQKLMNVCFQLGTFSNASNAQSLVSRLKAQGFYTAKTTAVMLSGGKQVQRVTYCKTMSHEEMLQARAKLTSLVGTSPIITR
jgi:cell division septation protein DedD